MKGFFPAWTKFPLVVLITTIVWVLVTFLTKPEHKSTLMRFYIQTTPGGPGWKNIINSIDDSEFKTLEQEKKWSVPSGIIAMILGCILVYSCMFATGNVLYGNYSLALWLILVILISGFLLVKIIKNKIL